MIDLSQLTVLDARNLPRLTCLTRITTRDLEALISLGPGERFGSNGIVTAVAFHPTRPLLAVGYGDGAVRLWDCAKGSWLYETEPVNVHRNNRIESLAFSPDGEFLAANQEFGLSDALSTNIWWSEDGSVLSAGVDWPTPAGEWAGEVGLFHRVTFAGMESLLVVFESPEYEVSIRDILSRESVRVLPCASLPAWQQSRIRQICLSPDRTFLALKHTTRGYAAHMTTLWDVPHNRLLGTLEDSDKASPFSQMAISPDNRWLAMILQMSALPENRSGSKYHGIGIWELATRRLVHILTGIGPLDYEAQKNHHLLFTPDGHLLLNPYADLRAWQVKTWQKLPVTEGIRIASGHSNMTAGGDGKLLAFCDYREVGVWGVPLTIAERQGLLAAQQTSTERTS